MHGLGNDRETPPLLTAGGTRFAAIDFESAGTGPGLTDEPVQIAIVHATGTSQPVTVLDSYIKPSRPVTWTARKVHGIHDGLLENAPLLHELWPQVRSSLEGRWVVAHGAATEKRFLRAFPLHGFGPWVDTLTLVRAAHPTLTSHSLGEAIGSLGLSDELPAENFRWHDARSDAIASLVLLGHLIKTCHLADEPAGVLIRPRLKAYFAARSRKPPRP
jgi:DNA polymerase III subunit epsilon